MTAATRQLISYSSSIDAVGPLHADATFLPDGRPKPMLLIMHGFACRRQDVSIDGEQFAERGFFCIAPDMRGHNDSAGKHDCGGLQIYDIVDALHEAQRRWPGECDPGHVNAVGYSGGGGNVLGLATRFPDLLNAAACFFGIPDYAMWHRLGQPEDCRLILEKALGGTPAERPERYAARNAIAAAINNPYTRLHLLWDSEEWVCPPAMAEAFVRTCRAAAMTNIATHVSTPGDPHRWLHAYRRDHPDLAHADALYLDDFHSRQPPRDWPQQFELTVNGYVVTRDVSIWLGDGLSGSCRVGVDRRDKTVEPVPGSTDNPPPLRWEFL